MSARPGYVYFFYSPETKLTKIGFSADPHDRKRALENLYGPLQVLGIVKADDAYKLEQELHAHAEQERVESEWFKLEKPLERFRNVVADRLVEWSEAIRVAPNKVQLPESSVSFPFAVQQTNNNYAASALGFPTLATATDYFKLERLMSEQLALALYEAQQAGETLEPPKELDLSDFEGEEVKVVYVSPAPMNPVSLELEAAVERSGLSQKEVASRVKTSEAAISRLTNPFYFGHSVGMLRRVAQALGEQLEVKLNPATQEASPSDSLGY